MSGPRSARPSRRALAAWLPGRSGGGHRLRRRRPAAEHVVDPTDHDRAGGDDDTAPSAYRHRRRWLRRPRAGHTRVADRRPPTDVRADASPCRGRRSRSPRRCSPTRSCSNAWARSADSSSTTARASTATSRCAASRSVTTATTTWTEWCALPGDSSSFVVVDGIDPWVVDVGAEPATSRSTQQPSHVGGHDERLRRPDRDVDRGRRRSRASGCRHRPRLRRRSARADVQRRVHAARIRRRRRGSACERRRGMEHGGERHVDHVHERSRLSVRAVRCRLGVVGGDLADPLARAPVARSRTTSPCGRRGDGNDDG